MGKFSSALLILAFVALSGCAKVAPGSIPPTGTDATLAKIGQAEGDVDVGVATALQATQQLFAAGTIDKSTAMTIANILAKVTAANGQAISITKGLAAVDPAHRTAINNIIVPIVGALQDSLTNGLLPIKDANAKAVLSASLSSLLVTLQIIQASTGGTQ